MSPSSDLLPYARAALALNDEQAAESAVAVILARVPKETSALPAVKRALVAEAANQRPELCFVGTFDLEGNAADIRDRVKFDSSVSYVLAPDTRLRVIVPFAGSGRSILGSPMAYANTLAGVLSMLKKNEIEARRQALCTEALSKGSK